MPRRVFNLLAAVSYVAFLAGIVVACLYVRRATIETLDTPQAHAEWDQWRAAVPTLNETGPVQRKVPKSAEPPALVLMRDRFGTVIAAGLVFGSLLFGALVWPLRAVLVPEQRHSSTFTTTPSGGKDR